MNGSHQRAELLLVFAKRHGARFRWQLVVLFLHAGCKIVDSSMCMNGGGDDLSMAFLVASPYFSCASKPVVPCDVIHHLQLYLEDTHGNGNMEWIFLHFPQAQPGLPL